MNTIMTINDDHKPLVSILMISYKHEAYIAQAIEGVLMQEVDFQIELVIGEDCSPDGTREVCETYANKYPDKINLLPSENNLGMTANYYRTMCACTGKYIAVCDGDDYWTDPLKLKKQVDYFEQHPKCGLVYSDVDVVSMEGEPIADEGIERRRKMYKQGDIFFSLLKNNFINTVTVMFRSDLLIPEESDAEKYWFTYDYWRWLIMAMRSEVGYLDSRTACYRIHPGGITNAVGVIRNRKRAYHVLHDIIVNFDKYYQGAIPDTEKMFLFRKMMSLIYRKEGTTDMKLEVLKLLPKYQPGAINIAKIITGKFKKRLDYSFTDKLASQP